MQNHAAQAPESLTPLQQAARERILFFKDELAKQKLYPLMGVELEFFLTAGEDGETPFSVEEWDVLNTIKKGIRAEAGLELAHYVSKLKFETAHNGAKPVERIQNELIVGDHIPGDNVALIASENPDVELASFPPPMLAAEKVADAAYAVKSGALKQALLSSSALAGGAIPLHKLCPRFDARPFEGSGAYDNATSGMHINTSVWSVEDTPYDPFRNRILSDEEYRDKAAAYLEAMQYHAGLMMQPSAASLRRNSANNSTSVEIGRRDENPKQHSVRVHTGAPSTARIENRLPGADADPYVAMAATLAAFYLAACGNDGILSGANGVLPETPEASAGRFERCAQLREALGDELYDAVLAQFRQEQEQGKPSAAR